MRKVLIPLVLIGIVGGQLAGNDPVKAGFGAPQLNGPAVHGVISRQDFLGFVL